MLRGKDMNLSLIEEYLLDTIMKEEVGRLSFRHFGTYWGGFDQVGMYNLVIADFDSKLANVLGDLTMAGKKDDNFTFKGFININMSVEQKNTFRAWDADTSEIDDMLATVLHQGYKLSAAYDNHNSAFVVSMTCKQAKLPNYGYTMSARAGDLKSAEALLMYKHFFLVGEVWESYSPTEDDLLG